MPVTTSHVASVMPPAMRSGNQVDVDCGKRTVMLDDDARQP
jgi:hypothetical protein